MLASALIATLLLGCSVSCATTHDIINRTLSSVKVAELARSATVKIEYERGKGSGFAVRHDLIVTAAHVMDSADMPDITTVSDELCKVVDTALFPRKDVALVWVKDCSLYPLDVSDHNLERGQSVWAAGHPLGFDWTVTSGVVSHPDRMTRMTSAPMLQMDAALVPGMSGGPVVDAHGHVVGMGVGLTTRDGMFGGISWAVTGTTIHALMERFWA